MGCVIPSFDDDPEARLMDEIAYTTDGELRSPLPKRARTLGGRMRTRRCSCPRRSLCLRCRLGHARVLPAPCICWNQPPALNDGKTSPLRLRT